MDDRQLIEAAARAAGIEGDIGGSPPCVRVSIKGNECGYFWRPLTNDGDALRLAVKLNLLILPQPATKCVIVDWYSAHDGLTEDWGDDKAAAVRRCIVHAAASIGGADAPDGGM